MKEANIQTLFGKHIDSIISLLRTNEGENFVFELKLSKANSIAFNQVKDHQIEGLLNAGGGFYHKISDTPIHSGMKSRFTAQKPFDCLYISKAKGYVVICWYKERVKKELHFIPVDVFIETRRLSTRKSLTYSLSLEVSDLVYNLNKKND